jgi:hypothetical protein
MGQPRNTPASQRECLVRLASKFERIVRDALDGRYEGSTLFAERPELKLATKIIGLNEGSSDLLSLKGHTWRFQRGEEINIKTSTGQKLSAGDEPLKYEEEANEIRAAASSIPELQHIVVSDNQIWPKPPVGIMDHIESHYRMSRGPELGTVCDDRRNTRAYPEAY